MNNTNRKLASIAQISNLCAIDGADTIEIATMFNLGWQVVVKKNEFKINEKIIFFEVDSLLPERPEFEFMRGRGFRLKTARLRGALSQGLIMPMSLLDSDYDVDTDVTEVLGVIKYEPNIATNLAGQMKGNFPSFLHKTDSERIQSNTRLLEKYRGVEFIASEKLDGSSLSIYYNRGDYGVCSRNYDIKESDLPASQEPNSFWKVAKEKGIIDKLKELEVNIALQGELIGPGVQKNKYRLSNLDMRVFDIYDIDKGYYMNTNDAKEFLSKHFPLLNWVPHVMDYTLNEDTTVEELLGYAEGKSALNPQQEREGLVWRPKTETFDIRFGRVAFKTISNRFLLKCED